MIHGSRQRSDYGSGKDNILGDDFKQPGDRIRGFSQASRDNLMKHLVAWLTDPKVPTPPPSPPRGAKSVFPHLCILFQFC